MLRMRRVGARSLQPLSYSPGVGKSGPSARTDTGAGVCDGMESATSRRSQFPRSRSASATRWMAMA